MIEFIDKHLMCQVLFYYKLSIKSLCVVIFGGIMELHNFSSLLHRIKNLENRLCKNFEDSTGFSLTRYEMLMFLCRHSSCLQVDIQSYLKIDQAAITRHLKILEKKGFVTRIRNEHNHREIFVSLTDKARKELANCQLSSKDGGECIDLSINYEDLKDLEDVLIRIEDSLKGKEVKND